MDDKNKMNRTGSKVSQIANIFQNMAPHKDPTETIILQSTRKPPPESPPIPKHEDTSPTQVTVVRTESHVARFNNARALFEKLGEENHHRGVKVVEPKMIPLQSTKSASSIHGIRSRSSSANSENSIRETRSRSPSPTKTDSFKSSVFSNSVPVLNTDKFYVSPQPKSNGHVKMGNGKRSSFADDNDLGNL